MWRALDLFVFARSRVVFVCMGSGVGLVWRITISLLYLNTSNVCILVEQVYRCREDVAQMVERSLSMREVQGSTPCFSTMTVLP